ISVLGTLPDGLLPRLTGNHFCLHCRQPIRRAGEDGFGRRHGATFHDDCQRSTDVYAAGFWCPHCVGQRTLLESPRWQWGEETSCPLCEKKFCAPNDDLLREIDPQQVEGRRFTFPCPACRSELACRVKHSGKTVVCLHCHQALRVPLAGDPVPLPEPLV